MEAATARPLLSDVRVASLTPRRLDPLKRRVAGLALILKIGVRFKSFQRRAAILNRAQLSGAVHRSPEEKSDNADDGNHEDRRAASQW